MEGEHPDSPAADFSRKGLLPWMRKEDPHSEAGATWDGAQTTALQVNYIYGLMLLACKHVCMYECLHPLYLN
jgi:hypothetical protein